MFNMEYLLIINLILLYAILRVEALRQMSAIQVTAIMRVRSIAVACCLMTTELYAVTEILSLFNGITTRNLRLFWAGSVCLLFIILVVCSVRRWAAICSELPRDIACVKRERWDALIACVFMAGMVILGAFSLHLAASTVPYNLDSMTYHLARVAHWYQNGSVAHYATNISRQLVSPPLGEFYVLHAYTMAAGMDRSVNLVQSVSYLISACLVVGMVRQLGGRRWMAGLSGILFMTMPIAFGESLTTQVDMVSCVYLLSFVVLAISVYQQETPLSIVPTRSESTSQSVLIPILCMGLCIGYGYLSKPSVCLGMMIYLIPVLLSCYRRRDSIRTVSACVIIAGVVAALTAAPELARMYATYHSFTHPIAGARQMVGSADPRLLLLNFIKNAAFNLPNAWMTSLPDGMIAGLYALAGLLGVELNNEAISEDGQDYIINPIGDMGHDTAINAGIMWLWILSLILLIWMRHRHSISKKGGELNNDPTGNGILRFVRTSNVAFLVMLIIVRWEQFEVRYQLPYLALLCVSIVFVISSAVTCTVRRSEVQYGVLGCVVVAILALTFGKTVNMVQYHEEIAEAYPDRPHGYYYQAGDVSGYWTLCEPVIEAGYTSVGIFCTGNYEYPIFNMLGSDVQIEHVLVQDGSSRYEEVNYQPDCILILDSKEIVQNAARDGLDYHCVHYTPQVVTESGYILLTR